MNFFYLSIGSFDVPFFPFPTLLCLLLREYWTIFQTLNPNKRMSKKQIISSQLGTKHDGHFERRQLEANRQRVTTLSIVLLKLLFHQRDDSKEKWPWLNDAVEELKTPRTPGRSGNKPPLRTNSTEPPQALGRTDPSNPQCNSRGFGSPAAHRPPEGFP